jgi:hypothetical protein
VHRQHHPFAFRPETVFAETKAQPQKPANYGLLGRLGEISRLERMRGGPAGLEPPTRPLSIGGPGQGFCRRGKVANLHPHIRAKTRELTKREERGRALRRPLHAAPSLHRGTSGVRGLPDIEPIAQDVREQGI